MPTPGPDEAKSLAFYRGSGLVLTAADRPGLLYSTAAPPPEGAPSHPFVDARAYDAMSEDELGGLLGDASDFADFVRLLLDAGYDAAELAGSPPMLLGPGVRLYDGDRLAGAAWDAPGGFGTLTGPSGPAVEGAVALVTAYRPDGGALLRDALRGATDFAGLLERLSEAGVQARPLA